MTGFLLPAFAAGLVIVAAIDLCCTRAGKKRKRKRKHDFDGPD